MEVREITPADTRKLVMEVGPSLSPDALDQVAALHGHFLMRHAVTQYSRGLREAILEPTPTNSPIDLGPKDTKPYFFKPGEFPPPPSAPKRAILKPQIIEGKDIERANEQRIEKYRIRRQIQEHEACLSVLFALMKNALLRLPTATDRLSIYEELIELQHSVMTEQQAIVSRYDELRTYGWSRIDFNSALDAVNHLAKEGSNLLELISRQPRK